MTEHYHKNEQGYLQKCYHKSRNLIGRWQFWAGMTLGFPIEHFIWMKLWPFYLLSQLLGLA